MTTWLSGLSLAETIEQALPGAVEESTPEAVYVRADRWHEAALFLRDTPGLALDFLNFLTAVDFIEYFQMVYILTSLKHQHACVIKARCWGREDPTIVSIVDVWRGADLQEREVYDLMGVTFTGRPHFLPLKRILLWEGYQGHPLRKDYMEEPLPYVWPHGG